MTEHVASRIGIVGAGRMGAAIGRRLVEGGFEVVAHLHDPRSSGRLAAAGLSMSPTVPDVVAGAGTVLIALLSDDHVLDVCLGSDGVLANAPAGSVVMVHTTGSPRTVAALASAAAACSIGVVDAPLSGGPDDIAAGRVTVYLGGSAEARDRVRPVLDRYANPVIVTGALGTGQLVKLVNNMLFAAHLGLARDAVRMATAFGLDPAVVLRGVAGGSGDSRGVRLVAQLPDDGLLVGALAEFLGKDLRTARHVLGDIGLDPGLIGSVLDSALVRKLETPEAQAAR